MMTQTFLRSLFVFSLCLLWLGSACAHKTTTPEVIFIPLPPLEPQPNSPQPDDSVAGQYRVALPPDKQPPANIVQMAQNHVGKKSIWVNGKSFPMNCSSFVRAMYLSVDVDLWSGVPGKPLASTEQSGVWHIVRFLDEYGLNSLHPVPEAGEVVYFDNTYDKNKNNQLDDAMTHIGLVETVYPNGTFSVIHHSNSGIVRDYMNLLRPNEHKDEYGHVLNGYLRKQKKTDDPNTKYLMSQLFAGFGVLRRNDKLMNHSVYLHKTAQIPDLGIDDDEPFALPPELVQ